MKSVLQEGALVAVIGAFLAFAANGLSPRGLELTKNYFPGTRLTPPAAAGTNVTGSPGAGTNATLELLAAHLREYGLQLADGAQMARWFRDPRREQDGVVFIDARDVKHYRAGHIPGAYHFDRFHPEDSLTNVVAVCLAAQQLVFYCNGGDCDDSEHAAIMLRDSLGIPKERVFVYGGGFAEWAAGGLPVEIGGRNSGQLTNVSPSVMPGKADSPRR